MNRLGPALRGGLLWLVWPQRRIRVDAGSSLLVVGAPGNGKSWWIQWLTREVPSLVVYDSKWERKDEWDEKQGLRAVTRPEEMGAWGRVVLRVPLEWVRGRRDWVDAQHPWGRALEHPMQRRECVAVFDEAYMTWPAEGGHPGTHRLAQQGRAPGVTLVVGMQITNHVDTRLMRLAGHVVVLGGAPYEDDVENLVRKTRVEGSPLRGLRRHEVAWWDREREPRRWRVFRKIRRGGRLRLVEIAGGVPDRWGLSGAQQRAWVGGLVAATTWWMGWKPFSVALLGWVVAAGVRRWRGRRWDVELEVREQEPQAGMEREWGLATTRARGQRSRRLRLADEQEGQEEVETG